MLYGGAREGRGDGLKVMVDCQVKQTHKDDDTFLLFIEKVRSRHILIRWSADGKF